MIDRATRIEWTAELSRTPERIRALLARLPEDAMARKPSPEDFSAREHVHHLRDLEIEGWSVRLDRLLREDHPELPGIDGDSLARERRYNERAHEDALDELARSRAASVARLRSLGEDEWARAGLFGPVGAVTVERLVEIWLDHDRGHLIDVESLPASLAR